MRMALILREAVDGCMRDLSDGIYFDCSFTLEVKWSELKWRVK